jgi:hypothetical protein
VGSILGPFFNIDMMPSVWDIASEDVVQIAMDNIAKDVQNKVRSRIDTGINAKAAIRARTITVRNEAGQLVIKTNTEKGTSTDNESVDDLFYPSTKPPTTKGGKLIFRKLEEDQLQRRNVEIVRNSVMESMSLNFSDHLQRAVRKVKSENPEIPQ